MEEINKLIEYLIAISNFSKDIHYNSKGEAFYSKHLLVDRVQENLSDYIDSIKEIFFLGAGINPLPSFEYLKVAADIIPQINEGDDRSNFEILRGLLISAITIIENMSQQLTKGEENLIGTIAENLQSSLGLINQQTK